MNSDLRSLRSTHRQALITGGLGTIGLSLPQLLRAETWTRAKAEESIIVAVAWGGPSQHDTELHDTLGRPYQLCTGRPIEALL
jgi:hypothetical protein